MIFVRGTTDWLQSWDPSRNSTRYPWDLIYVDLSSYFTAVNAFWSLKDFNCDFARVSRTYSITQHHRTGAGRKNADVPATLTAILEDPALAPTKAVGANAGGPAFDPAGVANVGNGNGGQFIGGQCLSGADCASGCCAGPSGICSGLGAQTQAGKTGCGFVSKKRFVVW